MRTAKNILRLRRNRQIAKYFCYTIGMISFVLGTSIIVSLMKNLPLLFVPLKYLTENINKMPETHKPWMALALFLIILYLFDVLIRLAVKAFNAGITTCKWGYDYGRKKE